MKVVNPYLNFNGNTEEAFNFYKSVFGGEYATLMRMKDAPGMPIPFGKEEEIMHIALPLTSGQMLMGSDNGNPASMRGNDYFISIHSDSVDEGQKLYSALAAGGKSNNPFKKEFWGGWHGNLQDKFGVYWMINFDEMA